MDIGKSIIKKSESSQLPKHTANISMSKVILIAQDLIAYHQITADSTSNLRWGSDLEVLDGCMEQRSQHIPMECAIERTIVEYITEDDNNQSAE